MPAGPSPDSEREYSPAGPEPTGDEKDFELHSKTPPEPEDDDVEAHLPAGPRPAGPRPAGP